MVLFADAGYSDSDINDPLLVVKLNNMRERFLKSIYITLILVLFSTNIILLFFKIYFSFNF